MLLAECGHMRILDGNEMGEYPDSHLEKYIMVHRIILHFSIKVSNLFWGVKIICAGISIIGLTNLYLIRNEVLTALPYGGESVRYAIYDLEVRNEFILIDEFIKEYTRQYRAHPEDNFLFNEQTFECIIMFTDMNFPKNVFEIL